MEFTIYDDDDVAPFLEGLEERPQRKVCVLNVTKQAVLKDTLMFLCLSFKSSEVLRM